MLKVKKTDNFEVWGKRSQTGFSLIELLVVVALISIVAGIASFYMSQWLPGIRLKSAARDFYGNMQQARLLAVKNNITIAVVSDPANNRYGICNTAGADNVWATFLGNGIVSMVDFATTYNSQTITYSAVEFLGVGSTVNAIEFNPDGTSTAGFFYLENNDPRSVAVYAIGARVANGKVILRKQ